MNVSDIIQKARGIINVTIKDSQTGYVYLDKRQWYDEMGFKAISLDCPVNVDIEIDPGTYLSRSIENEI